MPASRSFSFLAIALIVIDSRIRVLETVRVGVGVVLYPVQRVLLIPSRAFDAVGDYFATVSSLQRENERLKQAELANAQILQQARELTSENERLRMLLGARGRLGNASMPSRARRKSGSPARSASWASRYSPRSASSP